MAKAQRQLFPMTLAVTLGLAGWCGSGCALDTNADGTMFACPGPAHRCPSGFTCEADRCVASGGADAADGVDATPSADGPTDATPGVCELAALAQDNDSCGFAIDLTAAALMVGGTTVYGDTTDYMGDLNPSVIIGCTESPEPGKDAIYKVDALAGDVVHLTLTPQGWDAGVYLLTNCNAMAMCRGGMDAFGNNLETADINITTAGTYYVVVDASTVGAFGCYTLRVVLDRA